MDGKFESRVDEKRVREFMSIVRESGAGLEAGEANESKTCGVGKGGLYEENFSSDALNGNGVIIVRMPKRRNWNVQLKAVPKLRLRNRRKKKRTRRK